MMQRRALFASVGVGALGALTSGRAGATSSQSGPYVDSRAFGALGDGKTDDYMALQKALNVSVETGGALYLHAGQYRLSRGLVIKYKDGSKWIPGVRITGDSPGLAVGGESAGGAVLCPDIGVEGAVLSISGVPSKDNSNKGQVNGLVVENIGIKGKLNSVCDGIVLSYFTNVTLRNVHVGYCRNGVVLDRQANGATFGYGHGVTIDRLFAVANSGWGVLTVGDGAVNCVFIDPNLTENIAGGMKLSGCPVCVFGGGFFGNYGPAVFHRHSSNRSDSFGPAFFGTRFESNSRKTLGPQVILEDPVCAGFNTCYFLCSTFGEHGLLVLTKNKVSSTVDIENCRFSGSGSKKRQFAVVCDRRSVPNGLGSCVFSGFLQPILVSTSWLSDSSVVQKIGSLESDDVSKVAVESLRLGNSLVYVGSGGLASLKL